MNALHKLFLLALYPHVSSTSPVCLWVMYVLEGCKLLHLLGIGSMGALSACLVLLAYTLPFIRVVCRYLLQVEQEERGGGSEMTGAGAGGRGLGGSHASAKSAVSTLELTVYLVIATVATYWCREHHIAHNALEALLLRDPTELQQTCLCLAVWLGYLGCVLLVFFKSAKLMRRYGRVVSYLSLSILTESHH